MHMSSRSRKWAIFGAVDSHKRRSGEVMAALLKKRSALPSTDRRSFLCSLAGFGLSTKLGKGGQKSETVYRFSTPECDVLMSVEYFGRSEINNFRFRDALTNRGFCLSSNGQEGQGCLQHFAGSIAIAHYTFLSTRRTQPPVTLRERVRTIDQDNRMDTRPPFERALAIESEVVSDIQAFGFNPDEPRPSQPSAPGSVSPAVWCLLRQDLYLNDQSAAFLIVHWKHTLDFIRLLDVIPGDHTQLISGDIR
jgi:hypothetical protein